MKAILLAAGYATRLRPLTETVAKPLLPVGGRPLVDHLYDKLVEVPEVDAIHLVTNHKFAASFEAWAKTRTGRLAVTVHDDGTRSNEDRLGAIGDMQLTIDRAHLGGEDLLVVAGDNLFEFSLRALVDFGRDRPGASVVPLLDCPDLELVSEYNTVELDASGRIVSFVEKPPRPTTHLVAIATYLYRAAHVALIPEYLASGGSPDQPGNLVAWLVPRVPVLGYRFEGAWLDIGNHEQLLAADNAMRLAAGLPARATYALS